MKKAINKQYILTACLFIIYITLLTWIILFKFKFSFNDIKYVRAINLIPLMGSLRKDGSIRFSEIFTNIYLFVPFGIYIYILKKCELLKKVIIIFIVSLTFETLQYIFGIGVTDITDIVANILGGIIGIGIYYLFLKMFKDNTKANKIINIISIIFMFLIVIFLSTLRFK